MATVENSIGSIMANGRTDAAKTLTTAAAVVVYAAGIVYAEVHGWALMVRGVDPQMLAFAAVGMIALGITALALPLGLHAVYYADLQRYIAFGFYAVDLAALILNAALDYGLRTGGALPGWASAWLVWGVPSMPIVAAIGWSALWFTGPEAKSRAIRERTAAAAEMALADAVVAASRDAALSDHVRAVAENMAAAIVTQRLAQALRDVDGANFTGPVVTARRPASPEADGDPGA